LKMDSMKNIVNIVLMKMSKCKDCGKELKNFNIIRCPKCRKKNTEKRKYKRRHMHRKKMIKTGNM